MRSNFREDFSGELRSGEDTVVLNSFLDVVERIAENTVCRFCLAKRAKVVFCALHGQNSHPIDGSEVHLLPAVFHQSARDMVLHENLAQALDEIWLARALGWTIPSLSNLSHLRFIGTVQ